MQNFLFFPCVQPKYFDHAAKCAQLMIDNGQRLLTVQIEAFKAILEQEVRSAATLLVTPTPAAQLRVQQELIQKSAEAIMRCINEVVKLSVKTQAELNRLLTETLTAQVQEWGQTLHSSAGNLLPDVDAIPSAQTLQGFFEQSRAMLEQMTKTNVDAWRSLANVWQSRQTLPPSSKK